MLADTIGARGETVAKQKRESAGLIAQLREAIRQSGQSLNQLGAACGVGRDRLSRFLRAERGLTVEAAEKICRALRLRLMPERAAKMDEQA